MMLPSLAAAGCLLVAAFSSGSASAEWTSLSETVQFRPAASGAPNGVRRRFLSYYSDHFVDGQETAYNEYAQAWRLLGLYTDCDGDGEEEDGDAEQQDADAEEEAEEEEEEEVEEEEDDGSVCARRLLWAAVSL